MMRKRLLSALAMLAATVSAGLLVVAPAHAGVNGGPIVLADGAGWYGAVHFSHDRGGDNREGLLTCDRRVDGVSIQGQLRWQRAGGSWFVSAVDGDPTHGEDGCGRWTLFDIPEGRPVELRIRENGYWYPWNDGSVS